MERVHRQKSPALVKQMDFSLIHWAGIAMTIGFLFYFPFKYALFNGESVPFEGGILVSDIYLYAMLLLTAAHLYRSWKPNDWRGRMSIAVWCIPLIYWISSWQAVSRHDAQMMILIYCAMAILFIGGAYLAETMAARKVAEYSLLVSGYLIVLYGFLNLFGQASYAGAIWVTDIGNRLSSVFQYPNTYAAYLSAVLLASLYVVMTAKKPIWKFANALMLVPILLSLMLTLSRGALALLPVLMILLLVFLPLTKQLIYLIYTLVAGVITLILLEPVSTIAERTMHASLPDYNNGRFIVHPIWDKLPLSGWLWLIGGALAGAMLVLASNRFLDARVERRFRKLSDKKFASFLLPACLIALAILAAGIAISSPWVRSQLPSSIADRLENMNLKQNSVLERETFYRDALTLASDYPILGAGGGAWSSLYEKYQNNPYVSSQTHSFFFQILVEVGFLGLLIVAGFIGTVYFLYIRHHKRDKDRRGSHIIFYIFATSILVHSFMDFDMSFIYLSGIVFLCLGGMLSSYDQDLSADRKREVSKWRYMYPSAAALLSIVLLFLTFRLYGAHLNFTHAASLAAQGETLDQLTPAMDAAIHADPANPMYSLTMIDWLHQAYLKSGDPKFLQQRGQLINGLKRYEHVNRDLILAEYRYFKDLKDYDKVFQSLDTGVEDFKWDINFYEAAILEYYLAGERNQQDVSQRDQDWEQALRLYQEVVRRENLLKDLPKEQNQGRDFSVTAGIRQTIGQIYFYQGKYEEAADLLKPATTGDLQNEETRISTRYYLASLLLIGENDKELQGRLFNVDGNEQKELQDLVESVKP